MKYNLYEKLNENIDLGYIEFNFKSLATVEKSNILGVRIPILREIAKEFPKIDPEGAKEFLSKLPHKYYEENQIHGFLIQAIKDKELAIEYLDKFVPYIDNWATCDTISPKIFKKNPPSIVKIKEWINIGTEFSIRFGIDQLMNYYLTDLFKPEYLEIVSNISREEYYINMMRAWFFQEALRHQYPYAIKYLEDNKLDKFTHNKSIQKSIESFRVDDNKKEYLKSLRRK